MFVGNFALHFVFVSRKKVVVIPNAIVLVEGSITSFAY